MDSVALTAMPSGKPSLLAALHASATEARTAPVQPGHISALIMAHGSMELRWYAPQNLPGGADLQTPHDRDELYLVVSGTGVFVRAEHADPFDDTAIHPHAEVRVAIQSGDTLFVPAGADHRFEAVSTDFGAWMIFYGPEGGE